MKIISKEESSKIIARLNLNGVPEIVLHKFNKKLIEEFCDKFVVSKYILRDLENPIGQYYFCKNKTECCICAKNYKGTFSLGVSCFAYKNIVLLGDIQVKKDSVTLVARTDENANHRNIYDQTEINFTTTLDDEKLWDIQGFDLLIKYILDHNLYDVIVEFVVFDRNVGVNNEKVLIVELRSEY